MIRPKRYAVALATLLLFPALAQAAGAALPPNVKVDGGGKELFPLEEADGFSVAKTASKITVSIPLDAQSVVVIARCGEEKPGLTALFEWTDKSKTPITAKPCDEPQEGKPSLPDCYLQLPWNAKLYIRPDVKFYVAEHRAKIISQWLTLPAASAHFLRVEVRRVESGAQVWVDGRYIQDLPQKVALASLELSLPAGGAVKEISWETAKNERYLPLNTDAAARAGAAAAANISVKPSTAVIEGIPLRVTEKEAIDIAGLGRFSCPSDDLVSAYWSRSSLNGLLEARIVSVPLDTYSCVHILCAAEEDLSKVSEFTVRLTRYGAGRGDGMADTLVRLPSSVAQPGPDVKQAGTVELGPDGSRKKVPLWLVRVPLRNGLIQDVLQEDERKRIGSRLPVAKYLDLELLDPCTGIDEDIAFPPSLKPTGRTYTPRGPLSSVRVFAMTLERSSADLVVRTNTPVNMFYAAENPEFQAAITAREAGTFSLQWEFADIDGAISDSGKTSISFTAEKRNENVAVPVKVSNGWYATRFRLFDSAGRELIDHRASFVMLPPDTRQAGFDSPHGAWWFNWAHGGAFDIEHVGPALQRAGLRHTTIGKELPESATAPYKVTAWCIMWKAPTKMTVDEYVPVFEQHIRDTLKMYPNCLKTVMLFHESGSYDAPFPSEIWDEKPPAISPENDARWQNRMKYVGPLVKMIREKFPELKIQIGNDGDGCRITAELLRRGLSPKDYDYVAVEDLGQTFIPEKPVLGAMQSAWFLRQTARKLGNPDAQINGCYEWLGRRNLVLGLGGQAEWYVRDALQARAYGFPSIAIGTIHDAGMGYFHTIWGAGGFCYRYPYMYPKPSYAGIATLTRVLDTATFVRPIPENNSRSLYALEFKKGNEWVYAFWCPCGRREARLTFESDADALMTDMCGREKSVKARELELSISTAAQYVTSKTRARGLTPGKSSFPGEEAPKNYAAVEALQSMSNVAVAELKQLERRSGTNFPHRTKGNVEVREVEDAEKGKCLELELKPEGKIWELLHEHVYLKLKSPVVSTGTCEYAGVWVKGNSGWGDVIWEIADSKGQGRLLASGWPAEAAINFDGWHFLRLKLPDGPTWRSGVKITGLIVSLPRQTLYATKFVPVPELKVRVKDLSLF